MMFVKLHGKRNRGVSSDTDAEREKARISFKGYAKALLASVSTLVLVVSMISPLLAKADISDHAVEGVSPSGTTINVFDYWLTGRNESDISDPQDRDQIGINQYSSFHFGAGMGQSSYTSTLNSTTVNQWTGNTGSKPAARSNIVNNKLGSDGYPTLSNAVSSENKSLSYLFDVSDESASGFRSAYHDVSGLLQVDEKGYYYYNSQENFASLDTDANAFILYDTWAVNAAGTSPRGQFFPFNSGSDVFSEGADELSRKSINSKNSIINHYFGLNMSTRFVQQYGGHTKDNNAGEEVTYNFSGDDDVWVFIDGVLVGDLGGIHDKLSLEINFATGAVIVYSDGNNNNQYENANIDGNVADAQEVRDALTSGKDVYWTKTNLKNLFEDAESSNIVDWDGDTFADNSYHTLDFFYLERGNVDSNMSLKYNLVTYPETDIVKIDQEGEGVGDAEFELYPAEEDGSIQEGADPICSVETQDDGTVVLVGEKRRIITVETLYGKGYRNLVLHESKRPDGYRSIGDVPLYIEELQATNNAQELVLLSNDPWTTGAYAMPRLTATASKTIKYKGFDGVVEEVETQSDNSLVMFAVAQKKIDGEWESLYGDYLTGWQTKGAGTDKAIEAVRETGSIFHISSSGSWQVEIDQLPGNIRDYQYFNENGDYRVAYYYSSADDLAGANAENTFEIVNTDDFTRNFSAHLYIPNGINRFAVQKIDESGKALDGATFALYEESEVEIDEDGNCSPKEGAKPLQTGITKTCTAEEDGISLSGSVVFSRLEQGTYYIFEQEAPAGYEINTTPAKVIVDNRGVHADAGMLNDGVQVARGVGRLIHTMARFAAPDVVDMSLYKIVAKPQLGKLSGNRIEWSDFDNSSGIPGELKLHYADEGEGALLDYAPDEEGGDYYYTTDVGIAGMKIRQGDFESTTGATVQDLEGEELTNLFTGTTIVQMTDARVGNFTLAKTVDGGSDEGDSFAFDMTFTFDGDNKYVASMLAGRHAYTIEGDSGQQIESGILEISTRETEENKPSVYTVTDVETASGGSSFVEDDAGVYSAKLKDGQKLTVERLPVGTVVTTTEHGNKDYVISNVTVNNTTPENGVSATVSASIDAVEQPDGTFLIQDADIAYVNKQTAALSISKKVAQETSDPDTEFAFDISIENLEDGAYKAQILEESGNQVGETFDISFVDGKAQHSIKNGETLCIYGLPGGLSYTVKEVGANVCGDEGQSLDVSDAYTSDLPEGGESGELVSGETATVDVNNTYVPTSTEDAISLAGTKNLINGGGAGKELAEGDFTFAVTPLNGAPTGSYEVAGDGSYVVTNDDKGNIPLFDDIVFSSEDMDSAKTKDFVYLVSECKGSDTSISYDTAAYRVTVTVTDDGRGTLNASEPKIEKGTLGDGEFIPIAEGSNVENITFNNIVIPKPVTTQLQVTKRVTGAAAIEAFTFELSLVEGQDNAHVFEGTGDGKIVFDGMSLSTSKGIAAGEKETRSFDVITFTAPGIYRFAVREVTPEPGNAWTYDNDSPRYVTVEVTDKNGDGTLEADIKYDNSNAADSDDRKTVGSAAFTNSYGANSTATINVGGMKLLDHSDSLVGPDIDGKFTFTIEGSDGAPLPVKTKVTNGSAGNVSFGDIVYTMKNVFGTDSVGGDDQDGASTGGADSVAFSKREKVFTYTVRESGSMAGVTNDANAERTFTVTVTDNGDGTLKAECSETPGEQFTFVNSYEATPIESSPTGEGGITITKNLTGRDLNEGEFEFDLVGADGKIVATGTNDAQGDVELGDVKFTEPGTYEYTLRETTGDAGGVSYDQTVYFATAKVTEHPETATLSVAWKVKAAANGDALDDVAFENGYQAAPASVVMSAGKALSGRDLAAGEFEFQLTDAQGNVVSTATNGADGTVVFDAISFDAAGTYEYEISEVLPTDDDVSVKGVQKDGVTYDETVYPVTVTVTDDLDGHLVANAETDGAPTFTNAYNADEGEQAAGGVLGIPGTGDPATLGTAAGVLAVLAALAARAVRKLRPERGRHSR